MPSPSPRTDCGLRVEEVCPGHGFHSASIDQLLDGCPPGDMYIIPTNKAAWNGIGHRLGLIMMWVNRSYSTGEVRLTPAGAGTHVSWTISSTASFPLVKVPLKAISQVLMRLLGRAAVKAHRG